MARERQSLNLPPAMHRLSRRLWWVLGVTLVLGLWTIAIHPWSQRKAAWDWLEGRGHTVHSQPVWECPQWLVPYSASKYLRFGLRNVHKVDVALRGNRLPDEEWELTRQHTRVFRELTELDLVSVDIVQFPISPDFLPTFPGLESLWMEGVHLRIEDWQAISRMDSLRRLALDNTADHATNLGMLARLPKLESIKLGMSDLSIEQMKTLEHFPALKHLDLTHCSMLEQDWSDFDQALLNLQLALPDLQIVDD